MTSKKGNPRSVNLEMNLLNVANLPATLEVLHDIHESRGRSMDFVDLFNGRSTESQSVWLENVDLELFFGSRAAETLPNRPLEERIHI